MSKPASASSPQARARLRTLIELLSSALLDHELSQVASRPPAANPMRELADLRNRANIAPQQPPVEEDAK
jgi:hypothetical protein